MLIVLNFISFLFITLPELPYHFKFAVLFAGFKSKSLDHDDFFSLKINIPSLHVFGETDKVIPKGAFLFIFLIYWFCYHRT